MIADDHDLVRETIAMFLEADGNAETHSAKDLPEAIKKIETVGPFDLVLLDFTMPGMKGLEGIGKALAANGGKPVGLISGTATRLIAEQALQAGAAGFLPKTLPAKSLVNAVRFMIMGETFVPASALNDAEADAETEFVRQLSSREREVLTGLCLGKANKEIARELDLQEVTVKLHVRTLCRKIGAKNRTQAAVIAKEAGFA